MSELGLAGDPASASARGEEHVDLAVDRSSGMHDPSARRRWGTRLRWVVAAAVIFAVGAATGWVAQERLHQHSKEIAEIQALDAARKYAVALTTIDAQAIDRTAATILDGSTGEFKDLYTKSRDRLRQVLLDHHAVARGRVVEAAVKSASADKVEVLLFIDQSISNRDFPKLQIDRSRVRMTLNNVGGRWLVSRVELP